MMTALQRKQDTRQPADSGEYLPVPLAPITLPMAPPAAGSSPPYGSTLALPNTELVSRWWQLLCLLVPPAQAGLAAGMVWLAIPLVRGLPGLVLFLMALALPAASVAPVAALCSLGFARNGPSWRWRTMGLVSQGLALWVVVVPAWLLAASNSSSADKVICSVFWGVLAGVFLAAASVPGAVFGVVCMGRMAEPIVQRQRRKAMARHWLTRAWRAP